MPTTCRRRVFGNMPIGVNVPCGVSQHHIVADCRRSTWPPDPCPAGCRPAVPSVGAFNASRLPLRSACLRSVTCGSSAGSMPLIWTGTVSWATDSRPWPRIAGAAPTTCGSRRSLVGLGVIVGDAARLPDVDVRTGAENAVPKLLLEPGHDRQSDDHRHHADDHADRGENRDHGNEGLPALGQQIAKGDVELEGNSSCHSRFLISGNRITSRIDWLFVSSITSRSMPTPSPAVGGSPYSRARM